MSAFDGIEDAEVFENGRKMNPDHTYELEIVRMQQRKSGEGKGYIVPVEFLVLSSNDSTIDEGDIVSWVPKQSHGHAFLSNMTAFALAVLGCEPGDKKALAEIQEIDRTDVQKPKRSHLQILLDDATSVDNTFAGKRVRCQTSETTGKKSGNKFVVHRFFPMPEDE